MVFCPLRAFCLVVALLLCSPATFSQSSELRGKVIGVSDGDTITILDADRQQFKIRLSGIDAPESKQDFGQASKRHLSDLVFGNDVVAEWRKKDRYGRTLGKVWIGTTNANLEQIRGGFAWFYRQYANDIGPEDRAAYDRAETEAKAAKRGLWQQPNPQPPWEFRHGEEAPLSDVGPGPLATSQPSGKIIGNKSSQIYHLPNCPDYSKSAERNRVYFDSESEAQRAGFRKARNCP